MSAHTYPPERLVPYDAEWPARFAELAAAIRDQLGADWAVEHIGSTSVPGLSAKPVIDLAVRLPSNRLLGHDQLVFEELGWTEPVDLGTHDVMFRLEGNVRRAIAHLFPPAQWPFAHQRLFAAWLRTHPGDRDAYARLKRDLLERGAWGSEYTQLKAAFIQDVVNRARAARGLPPTQI